MSSNAKKIKAAYDDIQTLFALMAPDVEWHEMEGFPYGGVYHGPEEILANVFQRIGEDWDGFAAAADTILSAGDHVISQGYYTGAFKKTGKQMRVAFAHVFEFRDNKIVKFQQYADTALVRDAMASG